MEHDMGEAFRTKREREEHPTIYGKGGTALLCGVFDAPSSEMAAMARGCDAQKGDDELLQISSAVHAPFPNKMMMVRPVSGPPRRGYNTAEEESRKLRP